MITLDTKDELLLMMLFFGFRRLLASFAGPAGAARAAFPSPKGGAVIPDFKNVGGFLRGSRLTRESLTPAVGGDGSVANGLGLMIGASDG